MKLLNIIASPRGEKSNSLRITEEFLKTLQTKNPELVVERLDLFNCQLPELFREAVVAKYSVMAGKELTGEPKNCWSEITSFSQEFLSADIYLISSPMWNFSIPYRLKQYIDIIMQPGLLFKFTQEGVTGLAKNKKMICITSRGSDYGQGTALHQLDFQEPYLRAIFGLAGITDITFIHAQPMDYTPEIAAAVLEKALEEAHLMASGLTLAIPEPI